jgi:hypothetical protein
MPANKESKEHFREFVRDLDSREPKPESRRLRHEIINGVDFYTFEEKDAETKKTADAE